MKFRLIHQEKQWFDVRTLCRTMGVSQAGYWAWVRRKPKARDYADALLLADIRRVHTGKRRVYGSPRIHAHLKREGHRCGRKQIERLMRDNGISARQNPKHKPTTTDSNHSHPVADNILGRQFQRDHVNKVWVADITYIRTAAGWLYLVAVMDLCSHRIVGWAMSDKVDRYLPLRALHMALQRRRRPRGLLHHSDLGSQYASKAYRATLKQHGLVCSMSRKGNCWDNAPMESWFHTLKVELVQGRIFNTRRQATSELFEYVEVFYNRQRAHTSLGGLTPSEFEEMNLWKEA